MVEVVISTLLLSVGIVAVVGSFGSALSTSSKLKKAELVERLAQQKLDELISTHTFDQSNLGGEFTDNDYAWTATTQPTGVENLEAVTVRITKKGRNAEQAAEATCYVYVPPQNGGAGQ